jgi:hypothetical protein
MLRTATIALLSMTLLAAPVAASGDAPQRRPPPLARDHGRASARLAEAAALRGREGGVTRDRLEDVRDRRENRRDRREDLRDRRENRWDARHQGGRRDRREDLRDRRENRRDHREDVRDRREDRRDRRR